MGDHLDGPSIHYVIDAPQFHYYWVHTVGTEFGDYMFMTTGKKLVWVIEWWIPQYISEWGRGFKIPGERFKDCLDNDPVTINKNVSGASMLNSISLTTIQ